MFVAGLGKADVKFADSAGGYAYSDSDVLDSTTRNRFIYWSVAVLYCHAALCARLTSAGL